MHNFSTEDLIEISLSLGELIKEFILLIWHVIVGTILIQVELIKDDIDFFLEIVHLVLGSTAYQAIANHIHNPVAGGIDSAIALALLVVLLLSVCLKLTSSLSLQSEEDVNKFIDKQ